MKDKAPKLGELDHVEMKKRAKDQLQDHLLYRRFLKTRLPKASNLAAIKKSHRHFCSQPSNDSFLVFLNLYLMLDSSSPESTKSILKRNSFLPFQSQRFRVLFVEGALTYLYSDKLKNRDKFLVEFCHKVLGHCLDCSKPSAFIRSFKRLERSRLRLKEQAWLLQWAIDALDFFRPASLTFDPKKVGSTHTWIASCLRFLSTVDYQPQTIFHQAQFSFQEHPKRKKPDLILILQTTESVQKRLKKSYVFPDADLGVHFKAFSEQQFFLLAILAESDFRNRRYVLPQEPVRMTADQIKEVAKAFPQLGLSQPMKTTHTQRLRELASKINRKVHVAIHKRQKPKAGVLDGEARALASASDLIKSDSDTNEFWLNTLVPLQPYDLWLYSTAD